MRFAFAITALIAAVTAAPSKDLAIVNKRHGMTVHDAAKKCGTGQQLNCCNEQHSNEGDKGQVSKPTGALVTADGLLSHLIGTCGKLDVAALIGIDDLLNTNCKGQAACCQDTASVAQGGLLNLALPCIALDSLL
uniref:Hydrophobin n=1 Tax=Cordyceps farinosa TaxID=89141 RepID=E0WHQ8_9HYPO|nr:fungal hydrophobin [Cordyceps farinosa]